LTKTENKITSRISITFNECFPHSVIFNSVSPSLFFEEIEQVLMLKNQALGIDYNSIDTLRLGSKGSNKDYSIMDAEIENESQFLSIKQNIEHIIKIDCLPFFEKYKDLASVADLLSEFKPQEVVPYIQGAKLFSKTILILRETEHPRYEERRDEFYELLKELATRKEVYKQQLNLFELLFFNQSDFPDKQRPEVSIKESFYSSLHHFQDIELKFKMKCIPDFKDEYGAAKISSANCIISISLDRYTDDIEVYIINPKNSQKYHYGMTVRNRKVYLKETLPSLENLPPNQRLDTRLKNLAYLLDKYCSDLLSGDFVKLESN